MFRVQAHYDLPNQAVLITDLKPSDSSILLIGGLQLHVCVVPSRVP